jgi:hypothetical protein
MLGLMADTTKPPEGGDKRERTRLIIDTEEVIRRAVRLRALKTGEDNSEVVNAILREALADEIEEVSKYPQVKGGKKPGRKPKKRGGDE